MCSSIKEQAEIADFESMGFSDRRRAVVALQDAKLATDNTKTRRRRYRDARPYVHLARRERNSIFEAALDMVGGSSWKLFGEAIEKTRYSAVAPL